MKIEILGIDGLSCASEAWRLSRDVEASTPWSEVFDVDCPVNEMPSAFLHFRDFTILEREIVATSRTHVMWARTSFVDRPDKYRLPLDLLQYATPSVHAGYLANMEKAKAAGIHQDEWRQDLPLTAQTCFTCRVGYRDLVKLALYFKYLADHDDVAECLKARLISVYLEFRKIVDAFTGSTAATIKALKGIGLVKFLCEDDRKAFPLVETRGFYVVGVAVPLWLRAHFVRHRPLSFVDDLFAVLKRDDVVDLTVRYPVMMEIGASKAFWRTIMSKRSCWLTQSTLSSSQDPWASIVDQFGGAGPAMLPCADGFCPYHLDAGLRVEGKTDPGCPCPMYLKIEGINPAPYRERLDQALASRPAFWRDVK